MGLLEGKRAIVTGGASGIGLAACRRMCAEGARVAILDTHREAAEAIAKGLDGVARAVDVGDADALSAAILEATNELGGLDILVNNAGVGALASLHRYTPEDFDRLLRVNLTGVWNGIRAAVPLMAETGGGAIVNNASSAGLRPARGESPYSAAKAAVISLTQSAALEYGPDVRVNCVSPGVIDTPMTQVLFRVDGLIEPILANTPLRRAGTAGDVADVILFLASDLSRFMTGQNLVVDGGLALPQAGLDDASKALLRKFETLEKPD